MSNKPNNNEIRLTWVQGPNTSVNGWLGQQDPVQYEKAIMDALWNDLNSRVEAKCIEQELLGSDFAEARQIIEKIKQQIKGAK